MGEYHLSEEAEAELDDIWLYIARDSGSIERATEVIDNITGRFWFLATHPRAGRSREHDLQPALRSFPVGKHVIIYQIETSDLIEIVHVIDGRRDLPELLGETGSEK